MKETTLYLWDLANTLFPEKWNTQASGFPTHEAYTASLGLDPANPRSYEESVKVPYLKGDWYTLSLAEGFAEVLSWTKNNEAFTTGVKEQLDWRAKYLNPKAGFDIRKYFQNIASTFDYGETNLKTKEMLVDYLMKKIGQGYQTVVYTDDKLSNCVFFKEAAEVVKKSKPEFSYRVYHLLNQGKSVKKMDWYHEIGQLLDLLENEKIIAG